MAYGTIPVTTPPISSPIPNYPNYGPGPGGQGPAGGPSIGKASGGVATVSPYYQGLSASFANWLLSQQGQGATPFNLSQIMPSSGEETQPGQLSAGLTPILQQLSDFFQGKNSGAGSTPSAVPGLSSLDQLSKTGDPITALPAWQEAVKAMKQNTDVNAANLREQFAGGGTLNSTPYAVAASRFQDQTAKDQNSLLANMQQQALESAEGRKLTASTTLLGGAQKLGELFQGMDQAAIDRTLQEFIRTRPEYSPLLPFLQQLTTMFGPTTGKVQTGGIIGTVISDITGLLAAMGGGKGIQSAANAISGGSTGTHV